MRTALKTVETTDQQIEEKKSWFNMSANTATHTAFLILLLLLSQLLMNNISSSANEIKAQIVETNSSLNNNINEQIIFLKIMILNSQIEHELAKDITNSIYKWARVHGQDPDLMLALIKVESNFNPKAVSSVGAEGLTQIMPFWYEIFTEPSGSFKRIDKSIEYGYKILALYERQYGTVDMALTAYNRGHYRIESDLLNGKNPANGYAEKILQIYKDLKSMNIGS